MTFQQALGLSIQELRVRRQERVSVFAKNCNINAQTLRKLEKGLSAPRLSTIYKIASYSGISLEDLMCTAKSKEQDSKSLLYRILHGEQFTPEEAEYVAKEL